MLMFHYSLEFILADPTPDGKVSIRAQMRWDNIEAELETGAQIDLEDWDYEQQLTKSSPALNDQLTACLVRLKSAYREARAAGQPIYLDDLSAAARII